MQSFFSARPDLAKHVRSMSLLLPCSDYFRVHSWESHDVLVHSIEGIIASMSQLSSISLTGLPLDRRLALALHTLRHLRDLKLFIIPEFNSEFNEVFRIDAPLETLRISGSTCVRDMAELRNLLQCVCPTLKALYIHGVVDFDTDIGPLTFPRLECLSVEYARFTAPILKAFLERHTGSLSEANIACPNRTESISLSFVAKLILRVPKLVETWGDLVIHRKWGGLFVDQFAYAVQNVQVGSNRTERIVTELALALAEHVGMGADEIVQTISVHRLLPILYHFPDLRVLSLWVDRESHGVFSEFMERLGRRLDHLQHLKKLTLAWDVSQMRLNWADDCHFSSPEYGDSGLDDFESDSESGSDWPPAVNIPPFCDLRDGSLVDYRWRVWEAQNYPTVERIFREFFNRCPSVKVVEWYPFLPWHGEVETCWTWRVVKSRQCPGKKPSRFVVGDLSWKQRAVKPKTFYVAVGREAEYNSGLRRPY
ncbi:hypothetical protein BD410DRAFT_902824 [Rickenella mellea]|uniref:F-box domain-containing protein n=1 Tax=Rickenella mellea TaxID=50990 RepID=A0A4Y7PHJ7_9AGAM|nr:hypothetical protein BD410DRAFT_902824 [Rickenella mellea]